MSRVVRLERHRAAITVAMAIVAFLTEHQLSPGSLRVYAGALRALQDHLGADTALATLDEARTAQQLASWFHARYGQTAPATRVRQLATLRSACAFWRQRAWLATDPTAGPGAAQGSARSHQGADARADRVVMASRRRAAA